MKYKVEIWTIEHYLQLCSDDKINLNPEYQRNSIWSEKAQSNLIETINDGMPIPNFFLHERRNEKYDVTDGQQRSRAIIQYAKGNLKHKSLASFNSVKSSFNKYKLSVIIISFSVPISEIRDFYYQVNNTGLRLNRAESYKAKYFNTDLMSAIEKSILDSKFEMLGVFNAKQKNRMIDREFVEELFSYLKYGITDKKNSVDKMYELGDSISENELREINNEFQKLIEMIQYLDKQYPIAETRFRQKNDFYTLFTMLHKYSPFLKTELKKVYKILRFIEKEISPSNESCAPLQEYAFNCITQSNSKASRINRLKFWEDLIFSNRKTPNETQKSIIRFFKTPKKLIEFKGFYTINV